MIVKLQAELPVSLIVLEFIASILLWESLISGEFYQLYL